MERIELDGTWRCRPRGQEEWHPIAVPGCWEATGIPLQESGPVTYRRRIDIPPPWAGKRLWLRFDGVSHGCVVRLDGEEVGRHEGMWDPFLLEITDRLEPGASAELTVEAVKPAGLEAGPDSATVPGEGPPLRETLSGFLPYVQGHVVGGIWRSVALEATDGAHVIEAFARGASDGAYEIRIASAGPAEIEVLVRDPGGEVVARHEATSDLLEASGRIENPRPWSPRTPTLYEVEVRVDGDDLARRRFGFRSFGRDGTILMLNDEPVYPRMILNWGWYPEALHSDPGPERVRADLQRLRALGFNGVKYCLWVPPDHVLDLADEMGMLVWLELPMWLPRTTERFLESAPREYERIVRHVRSHPSIVIVSLGCELSSEVGADLLERLYDQTKALVGDALLRDNSGSGEAYGGLLDEYADYYDYHFYSELPTFRPLLDHFAPRWRPEQPFVFGEFCDSDTFRDLRSTDERFGGRPWWATADPLRNPQGARWQYDLPWQQERLERSGLWERSAELEEISYRQALLQRKHVLEIVRTYREIGGYVVTGEVDTPISTAGVLDDAGEPKFAADAFRVFNDDSVLAIGWDKRRRWIHGGDRAAYVDPYGYRAGDRVRAHLVVSHYGPERGRAEVEWRLRAPDGRTLVRGRETSVDAFTPGSLREACIADFTAPEVDVACRAVLEAEAEIGGGRFRNAWPLWLFPRAEVGDVPAVRLVDPEGVLAGVESSLRLDADAELLLCTEWTRDVAERVEAGAHAVAVLRGRSDDPFASAPMPFWREAVKVIEPHPAWGGFPHDGWTDLQFFGVTPDRALDVSGIDGARPLLRRVDVRTMAVHDYAAEVPYGAGRVLATTLRFGGGLGEQALGLARNVCAQELLRCWVGGFTRDGT